jgi:pseudouridylate synthase / pseudouridine kinase
MSFSLQPPATLLVIGAAAIDVISQPVVSSTAQAPDTAHSTHPGKVTFSSGGVARNIAEAAHRILSTSGKTGPHEVLLVSPIGNDLPATLIIENARKLGMRTDGFLTTLDQSLRSAICNMHLDTTGNLAMGVADMAIVEAVDARRVRPDYRIYHCPFDLFYLSR